MADIIEEFCGTHLFKKEREYALKQLSNALRRKGHCILGAYTDVTCPVGKKRLIESTEDLVRYLETNYMRFSPLDLNLEGKVYPIRFKQRDYQKITRAVEGSFLVHNSYVMNPNGKQRLVCNAKLTDLTLIDLIHINKGKFNILEFEFIAEDKLVADRWYELVRRENKKTYTLRSAAASTEVKRYIDIINLLG